MTGLAQVILARDPEVRNRSLEDACRSAHTRALLDECTELERFRRASENLYERVRAQFFLYAIHRFYLPYKPDVKDGGQIPFAASVAILKRRYEEAIDILLKAQA